MEKGTPLSQPRYMTDMSPLQRAKRYRELAQEARAHAATSLHLARDVCSQLAGQWEQLARETELEAEPELIEAEI